MNLAQNKVTFPDVAPERKAEIGALANSIWRRYCNRIPVDFERIITSSKFHVRHADHDSFEGATAALENDGFFIVINRLAARYGARRSRFTMAHELGHCFIWEHALDLKERRTPRVRHYPTSLGELLAEKEADYFASTFLMPDDAFWPALHRGPSGLSGAERIATTFDVSMQAAILRCMQATRGLRCAMVMFPRSKGPWIEVSGLCSSDWCLSRQSRLKRLDPPPPGLRRTRLEDWFIDVPIAAATEQLLEETMVLGKYGTVSLLYENGHW